MRLARARSRVVGRECCSYDISVYSSVCFNITVPCDMNEGGPVTASRVDVFVRKTLHPAFHLTVLYHYRRSDGPSWACSFHPTLARWPFRCAHSDFGNLHPLLFTPITSSPIKVILPLRHLWASSLYEPINSPAYLSRTHPPIGIYLLLWVLHIAYMN